MSNALGWLAQGRKASPRPWHEWHPWRLPTAVHRQNHGRAVHSGQSTVDSCGVLGMEVGDDRTRPPETATVITEGDGARGISHAGTVDRRAAAASWSAQMNLSDALAHQRKSFWSSVWSVASSVVWPCIAVMGLAPAACNRVEETAGEAAHDERRDHWVSQCRVGLAPSVSLTAARTCRGA
jgi:hypothetical protein